MEAKQEGEEIKVEVRSNVDFTSEISEKDKSWLKPIAQTRGLSASVLKFAVLENKSDNKREGTITFRSGNLSEVVSIYQSGITPSIVISETNYKIPAAGQDITIELQSKCEIFDLYA